MALNIKPFEGPRSPDWTDPPHDSKATATPHGQDEKRALENSNTHLLYLTQPFLKAKKYKLKKLDIL